MMFRIMRKGTIVSAHETLPEAESRRRVGETIRIVHGSQMQAVPARQPNMAHTARSVPTALMGFFAPKDVVVFHIAQGKAAPGKIVHFARSEPEAYAWGRANLPALPGVWHVGSSLMTAKAAQRAIDTGHGRDGALLVRMQNAREYENLAAKKRADTRAEEIAQHQRRAEEQHEAKQREAERLRAATQQWERDGTETGAGVPEFMHGQGGWQWVYVFSFNTLLELAKHRNEAPVVKIGMTTNHYSARIAEQIRGQSAIHERATTIMAIRCTNAAALESRLHSHFACMGRQHVAGGGREWFKCTPAEILQAAGPLTRIN